MTLQILKQENRILYLSELNINLLNRAKNIFLHIVLKNAEKAFPEADSILPTSTPPLPILPRSTETV